MFLVIGYAAAENDNFSSKVGIPDPEGHAYRNTVLQKRMKKGPFESTHGRSTQRVQQSQLSALEYRPAVWQGQGRAA